MIQEAQQIRLEDIAICRAIGRNGAALVPDGKTVLTHCNAGALATAGYGTALGVIRAAVEAGKKIDVFADETRPFLQGARLTAWELQQDGIPTTLITDNMAGHFLHSGRIGCVVVGADRIAANGDVANKIGTYSLAVLAKENGVPFYVAAPVSTFDLTLASGDAIPIEQRAASEVTHVFGVPVAPENIAVENPAFDVTPARYVTAIICEKGVARAPYEELAEKHRYRMGLTACRVSLTYAKLSDRPHAARCPAVRTISLRPPRPQFLPAGFRPDPARYPRLPRPLAVAGLHEDGLPALRGALQGAGAGSKTSGKGRGAGRRDSPPETTVTVAKYTAENKMTSPIVFDQSQVGHGVLQGHADQLASIDTPHLFVINPEGKIVRRLGRDDQSREYPGGQGRRWPERSRR